MADGTTVEWSCGEIDHDVIDCAQSLDYNESVCIEEDDNCRFNYQRIGYHLQAMLTTADEVTCCAAHEKFLVFGTLHGRVILLDHQGNSVTCEMNVLSTTTEKPAVIHVDVDSKGEYVSSYSVDGRVQIQGLYTTAHNRHHNIGHAIKCLACSSSSDSPKLNTQFIVAHGGTLTLYEENWNETILKSKHIITSSHEVIAVKWSGDIVAWVTNNGVIHIYDVEDGRHPQQFSFDQEDTNNHHLADHRCCLFWSDKETLLTSWRNKIYIYTIEKMPFLQAIDNETLPLIITPINTLHFEYDIADIAKIDEPDQKQLVLLGYPQLEDKMCDNSAIGLWFKVPLFVVHYTTNNNELNVCKHLLRIHGIATASNKNIRMVCLQAESCYFVVFAQDIVVASLCKTEERIQRLIDQRKYEEAMMILATNQELYSRNNSVLWSPEIFAFLQAKQLRTITVNLPTKHDNHLDVHIYEMLLVKCFKCDAQCFLNTLQLWPKYLYDVSKVIAVIEERFAIDREQDKELVTGMSILYSHQKNFKKAVEMYLCLKNKEVFNFINRHSIYYVAHSFIRDLIGLDREKAFEMLFDSQNFPSNMVASQLEKKPKYLYWFLDELESRECAEQHHDKLVKLYAHYDRSKLLPLLRRSTNYRIQDALKVCKRKCLHHETVYLLEQMGNMLEALQIILLKLRDPIMAIEFCREHDDHDLWEELFQKAADDPYFLTQLLENTSGNLKDLTIKIERLKQNQKIPGLQQALVKMLQDYRKHMQYLDICNKILAKENFTKIANLNRVVRKGRSICDTQCPACNFSIFRRHGVVILNCGHIYHQICLQPTEGDEDPQCKACNTIVIPLKAESCLDVNIS